MITSSGRSQPEYRYAQSFTHLSSAQLYFVIQSSRLLIRHPHNYICHPIIQTTHLSSEQLYSVIQSSRIIICHPHNYTLSSNHPDYSSVIRTFILCHPIIQTTHLWSAHLFCHPIIQTTHQSSAQLYSVIQSSRLLICHPHNYTLSSNHPIHSSIIRKTFLVIQSSY